MKTYLMLVAGLLMVPAVACAEMITGTVTNVDLGAQKVTLLRSDTNQSVTVRINDEAQLRGLNEGSRVNLDANKHLFGGWEADTLNATNVDRNTAIPDRNRIQDSNAASTAVESESEAGYTNKT